MGKRVAALLACKLAIVTIVAPAQALAYSNTPPTAIYVNNVDITQDSDYRVECGEGYAEFDPDTGVLTLNNASVTETYFNPEGSSSAGSQGIDSHCGIYTGNQVDLVIELVGENRISGGIQTWGVGGTGGDITISGEGSLEVVADMANGITPYRDLTISGATVSFYSSTMYAIIPDFTNSEVIRITDGAHVEAKIPVEADVDNSLALYTFDGLIVEDAASFVVDGRAYVKGSVTVESNAGLSASSENANAQYALYAIGGLTVKDASLSATHVGDYGIVSDAGLTASNSRIEARSVGSYGMWVRSGAATIDGGSVTLSSTNGAALCSASEVGISNCVLTLEGAGSVIGPNTTLGLGDASWYQWATSATATPTLGSDVAYDPAGRSDAYLRIEPAGTTYELTVVGGEGSGSYAPGL